MTFWFTATFPPCTAPANGPVFSEIASANSQAIWILPTLGWANLLNAPGLRSRSYRPWHPGHVSTMATVTVFEGFALSQTLTLWPQSGLLLGLPGL